MVNATASILNNKNNNPWLCGRVERPALHYFYKNIHIIYYIFLLEICRGLFQVQQQKYVLRGNQWLK